jgi:peptide deformylase
MSVKKISEIGSDVIRTRAKELSDVSASKLQKMIDDLTETMRGADLVGIAAPQIGVGSRVFLSEIRKTKVRKDISEIDSLRVFINPVLVKTSKKQVEGYEGCGSVARGGLYGIVTRPESVVVRAHNEHGDEFELETGGLLARVIQHEIDHLNGICFIDKVTDTKTLLGREEYITLKKKKK